MAAPKQQLDSKWRNRIVKHGVMRAGGFLANPLNWRIHPDFQQEALSGALEEIGWIDEVTVNKRTGRVVDGHLRVTLALRAGEDEPVPYREVDLSEAEEALALATKDPLSALAGADADQLAALTEDISTGDAALMQLLDELNFDHEMTALLGDTSGTDVNSPSGDKRKQVRVVLYVDQLMTFENAILATGLQNRGEATASICQAYLDAER